MTKKKIVLSGKNQISIAITYYISFLSRCIKIVYITQTYIRKKKKNFSEKNIFYTVKYFFSPYIFFFKLPYIGKIFIYLTTVKNNVDHLGLAGGAGGEHDEERRVERQLPVGDWLIGFRQEGGDAHAGERESRLE